MCLKGDKCNETDTLRLVSTVYHMILVEGNVEGQQVPQFPIEIKNK